MAEPTFALAIPHAPWVEGRAESLGRLLHALGPQGLAYELFDEKAPNHVWSLGMWSWGAVQSASHFLTLQDDAVISDDFWGCLKDIVAQRPDDVIGLHVAHPHAAILHEEGRGWCTTADAIVGVAYCMPTTLLAEFLIWRAEKLAEGAVEAIPEDTLVGLWCMVTGRKVYHPLPTIVDHDTTLTSAYGNDGHAYRKSAAYVQWPNAVEWGERGWDRWVDDAPSPHRHLGRMWDGMLDLAEKWVLGVTPDDLRRWAADDGRAEKRRLGHVRRGKVLDANPPRILVCTPTRGGMHPEYAASVWRMLRDESYEVDVAWELDDAQAWGSDVVRVRSRMVNWFLTKTAATHLLFIDSDVGFSSNAIRGMLAANKDFVACPYPRRDTIDLKRVRDVTHVPPEAAAYRYSCRMMQGAVIDETTGCLRVEGVPLGCALLSRAMLQEMVDLSLGNDEGFTDKLPNGQDTITAPIFMLETYGGMLLSEDYSFCNRYRRMGGKVWMYLGEGSPVSHAGEHVYHGVVESFGYQRKVGT